jgi:hypothetical protein
MTSSDLLNFNLNYSQNRLDDSPEALVFAYKEDIDGESAKEILLLIQAKAIFRTKVS